MNYYKKILILFLTSIFIITNIASATEIANKEKSILIKNIIISKFKLGKAPDGKKHVKNMDKLFAKLENKWDLEKFQKISEKIDLYISNPLPKNIKKQKELSPILKYLNVKINYKIYKIKKSTPLVVIEEEVIKIEEKVIKIEEKEVIKTNTKKIKRNGGGSSGGGSSGGGSSNNDTVIIPINDNSKIEIPSSSPVSKNSIEYNYINKDFSKNTIVKGTGNIYYIDSTNGNDNNNGLSESEAWKTIKNITYKPGESILIKRNTTLKWGGDIDASGIEGNPFTLGAYGDGKQPIITSISEKELTWETYEGNIWKSQNPINYPNRLYVDNKEILKASNYNEIDGIKYLWYYDYDENNTNNTLYIYSNTNPNNKNFKYSNRYITIRFQNTSYINIQDVNIQGGFGAALRVQDVENFKIQNSNIGQFANSGIQIVSKTNSNNNFTITNNIIKSNFHFNYDNAKTSVKGTGDGIQLLGNNNSGIIYNNYIKNWGHANINLVAAPDKKIHDIKIYENFSTSPDISYGGRIAIDGNAYNIETYNNIFYNIAVRNQLNGHDNYFHHNVIDGVKNSTIKSDKIGQGIHLESYYSSVYNNIYEYNTIINTDNEGIGINGDVYNNTFKNNIIIGKDLAIKINKPSTNNSEYGNNFNNNILYSYSLGDSTNYQLNAEIDENNLITEFNKIYDNIEGVSNLEIIINNYNTNYDLINNNIYKNPELIEEGLNKYKSINQLIKEKYGIEGK